MKNSDYLERLHTLDDRKLVEVVKNYRQYGYDVEVREKAMSLLGERGISKEDLKMLGNFDNVTYDEAQYLFVSFNKNSKIAFFLYGFLLLSRLFKPALPLYSDLAVLTFIALQWLLLFAFLYFFIRSALKYSKFYKKTESKNLTDSDLFYVLIGMPLYLFAFFYFRTRMKEKMREIK